MGCKNDYMKKAIFWFLEHPNPPHMYIIWTMIIISSKGFLTKLKLPLKDLAYGFPIVQKNQKSEIGKMGKNPKNGQNGNFFL